MKIRKLCVAVPNLGSIKTDTVYCMISSLFRTTMELACGLHMIMPYGCLIDENRNVAAQEALDVGASHLMFIDSDMSFPDDGIITLGSRNKQVIGANYNLRDGSGRSTVKMSDKEGNLLEVPGKDIPVYPFKCYAVATGFMLIQTDALRAMSKPWFFYEWDPDKEETVGEDVFFCKKARREGIDVWCDPTIEVKHIGDFQY